MHADRGAGGHVAALAWLSPTRAHQITAGTDLDGLDAALEELRAVGWPAPKTPTGMTMPSWTGVT